MATLFRGLAISRVLTVAACAIVLAVPGHAHAAAYVLNVLPAVAPDLTTASADVNNSGQVIGYGYSGTPPQTQPFIWSQTAGMQNLSSSLGTAAGLNNLGQVAGYKGGPMVGAQAYLWTPNVGSQNIGTLPGFGDYTFASDVNDSAQVVGYGNTFTGQHAFVWSSANGMQDLGTLPGGNDSYASAINSAGQVVGYADSPSRDHAFVWSSTSGMQALSDLPSSNDTFATDINDVGQVVGNDDHSTGPTEEAFLWSAANGMQDLGTLGPDSFGFNYSEATGIDNAGQVVGTSESADGSRAFVWDALSGMIDLNTLIDPTTFILESVSAISGSGLITGFGYDPTTQISGAFLLTPTALAAVPTPGALALLISGLLLIGTRRKPDLRREA